MTRVQGSTVAVQFPTARPPGYSWLENEPEFDPAIHLELGEPDQIVMLADLGYPPGDIDGTATPVAASSPFRVLSAEGARVMLEVARRLRVFCTPAGDRIERVVRNGCYRSAWLRDLCISPEVTQHLANIYRVPIAPHPLSGHLGHINYEPSRIETAVDKWHHDTLPLDYVMMVTDPAITPGGRFEYFTGTKDAAAALRAAGSTPSDEHVVAPNFPGPGWAIALHGNMVVHRGGPVTAVGERITMVNGYVATDTSIVDQSRNADLIGVDDPAVLYADWARFAAWRSRDRLDRVISDMPFGRSADDVADELEAAIADVRRTVDEMRAGVQRTDHYE
ncbi:MAG: hypothetical protein QNM02_13195 [Acidimicrobiia bacterium]|nr:hypothetical protein [Acidimicrobiia bacterium]